MTSATVSVVGHHYRLPLVSRSFTVFHPWDREKGADNTAICNECVNQHVISQCNWSHIMSMVYIDMVLAPLMTRLQWVFSRKY